MYRMVGRTRWNKALVVVLAHTSPLSGQDADASVTLVGVLVDATNGARLPETLVTLDDQDRTTLSDAQGIFTLDNLPVGEHRISFKQYGYEEHTAVVTVGTQQDEPRIFEIQPNPLLVDGITAVVDRLQEAKRRLESRRRATPLAVRNFDQSRLLQTPARDMAEFLQLDAGLSRASCGGRSFGSACFLVRGRVTTPRVYIDEAPMIGGMEQLAAYRPTELYAIEIYQGGREIRVYTHQFMERMARRPVALIPIIPR